MEAILGGLALLWDPMAILALVGGVFLGVVIGVLPGLGPAVGVSLALPLTIGMDQIPAITLLLGIYAGSIYGGSVTAILINTPGTPSSAASCLDGYPMARSGKVGEALGIAAVASVAGGIISLIILAFAAPYIAQWALNFGPAEMLALVLFSLTCIASVAAGNQLKGLLAAVLGLFLAVVGQDIFSGEVRYNFGVFELSAGLSLVPLLVGLFALSEVFWRMGDQSRMSEARPLPSGFVFPGFARLRQLARTIFKSSLIGTLIGVLPGVGPTAASFVSYAEARRSSEDKSSFGKGAPEGLAASEAANNAVTGGALIPTLALGVPGDPITAIMLGALVIQDIVPGPSLFSQNLDIVTAILIGLLFINLLMLPTAKYFAFLWRGLLRLPDALLMAGVVILIGVGIYTLNNSVLDMVTAFIAGLVGYGLRRAGYPLAPIIIGFVLGKLLEQNLRMGLIVFQNDWTRFATSPIAAVFLILTAVILCWPIAAALVRARADKEPK